MGFKVKMSGYVFSLLHMNILYVIIIQLDLLIWVFCFHSYALEDIEGSFKTGLNPQLDSNCFSVKILQEHTHASSLKNLY